MNKQFFGGKKVLIMGLGRFGGGLDSAKFAEKTGAIVTVTDILPPEQLEDSAQELKDHPQIQLHLGGHQAEDFEQNEIIIANPAVPPDNEFLNLARKNNKLVTSQMNIFFQLCPATIIGITGANGKSTTAALTAHILNSASPNNNVIASEAKQSQTTQYAIRNTQYENVFLSGNIGNQPLLTNLDQITPNDLIVLEISSFQSEDLANIQQAPKIALLTNLTPNHLDRHGTFEEYCKAKENLFKYQPLNENDPAISIFNAEDEVGCEWFDKYQRQNGRVCIKFSPDDINDDIIEAFPLPGRANLSNLSAAVAIARHFGITDEQIANSLPNFKPLPHRLELVAEINGVKWYNDSISTTPISTIAALEAFDEPKILISGGYDKNLPFDELAEKIITTNTKTVILIGQTAPKIADSVEKKLATEFTTRLSSTKSENTEKIKVEILGSLDKAVQQAHHLATAGDVVLLSPACASYDQFQNFQQRGNEFTKLAQTINRKG
jgi:UDP-N-acetylmuramoylalanine--D-glutamate ligase